MIPLRDDQPRFSAPFINYFLIVLNVLFFFFEAVLPPTRLNICFSNSDWFLRT